jgi:hypothetical protein
MHKFPIPIAHDISPARHGSNALRTTCIIALGFVLAGPIEEAGAVCVGQWCQLMGTNIEIRTPILDLVNDNLETANSSVWSWLSPQFHRLPWKPSYVLPVAAVIMVVGTLMLRL